MIGRVFGLRKAGAWRTISTLLVLLVLASFVFFDHGTPVAQAQEERHEIPPNNDGTSAAMAQEAAEIEESALEPLSTEAIISTREVLMPQEVGENCFTWERDNEDAPSWDRGTYNIAPTGGEVYWDSEAKGADHTMRLWEDSAWGTATSATYEWWSFVVGTPTNGSLVVEIVDKDGNATGRGWQQPAVDMTAIPALIDDRHPSDPDVGGVIIRSDGVDKLGWDALRITKCYDGGNGPSPTPTPTPTPVDDSFWIEDITRSPTGPYVLGDSGQISVQFTGIPGGNYSRVDWEHWVISHTPDGATIPSINSEEGRSTTVTFYDPGTYRVKFLAEQRGVTHDEKEVEVHIEPRSNTPPTATISGAHDMLVGETMWLTAHGADPNGDVLTFHWSIESGSCRYNRAEDESAEVTCFGVGRAEVKVTVEDGHGGTGEAFAVFTVAENPNPEPQVSLGEDFEFLTQAPIRLRPQMAVDPEGGPLSYQWTVVNGNATVEPTDAFSPILTLNAAGQVEIQLTVTEEGGRQAADSVTVTAIAPDQKPAPNARTLQIIEDPALLGHKVYLPMVLDR